MRMTLSVAFILAFGLVLPAMAQPRVSPDHLYERVFAVVRMVGSGTWEDPRRPEYAPNPGTKFRQPGVQSEAGEGGDSRGIIGFSYQVSDDGNYALVEFIATEVRFLQPLLDDRRADIKVFRLGRATKQEVETEFRRHKSDFSWTRFGKGRDL